MPQAKARVLPDPCGGSPLHGVPMIYAPDTPVIEKKKNYGTGICFKSFYAVFVKGHLGGTAVNYAMKI
jgi:hypothetical protein